MFGSFLPSLGCLAAIKSTQIEGADSVMKSSGSVPPTTRKLASSTPKEWGSVDTAPHGCPKSLRLRELGTPRRIQPRYEVSELTLQWCARSNCGGIELRAKYLSIPGPTYEAIAGSTCQ